MYSYCYSDFISDKILFLFIIAYRARLHALPPPEALRSVMPYVSERMRKRRAFADKELETVMFERERQVEDEKVKIMQSAVGHHLPPAGTTPAPSPMDPSKNRQLMGQLSPTEFLQRIFPAVNPNVLELVWQGCGGDLERAIEQIVSNNSMSNLHAAHMAQQMALQHRLMAAQMAAMTGGKLPGGRVVPSGANLPHALQGVAGAGALPEHPQVCQAALLQHQAAQQGAHAAKQVGSSESAFTTPVVKPGGVVGQQMVASALPPGFPVGHPAAIAGLYSYQAAQAALVARMCPNGQPSLPGHPHLGQAVPGRNQNCSPADPKELLSQKSAFSANLVPPAASPTESSLSPSSSQAGSSGTPLPKSPGMESPQSCSDGAKSPIKFSVESIIGK